MYNTWNIKFTRTCIHIVRMYNTYTAVIDHRHHVVAINVNLVCVYRMGQSMTIVLSGLSPASPRRRGGDNRVDVGRRLFSNPQQENRPVRKGPC